MYNIQNSGKQQNRVNNQRIEAEVFDEKLNLLVDEQIKIIKKGADKLIHEGELREKLKLAVKPEGSCVIKLGLDPSAPDIHLGYGRCRILAIIQ